MHILPSCWVLNVVVHIKITFPTKPLDGDTDTKFFKMSIFTKKIISTIKHDKTRFIQKILFLNFIVKHFLENVKNRLFYVFDLW